jgi:hypothetical protein
MCQCFSAGFLISPALFGSSYTFKVGCKIPFSMRWVFRVLYMFNCCSGWSTNSCCSTLLGFGPLMIGRKNKDRAILIWLSEAYIPNLRLSIPFYTIVTFVELKLLIRFHANVQSLCQGKKNKTRTSLFWEPYSLNMERIPKHRIARILCTHVWKEKMRHVETIPGMGGGRDKGEW